ncbi:MAG TPA: MFS transporter [Thermomicrobiales bacterium]|nr:MFS transporter [Thermomicrobiales bacterium]
MAIESAVGGFDTAAGRGFVLIAIAALSVGFAMAAQQNVVSNFFEDSLGFGGPAFGYITAIREIPGFLLIFLTALFYRLSLPHLTAGALLLLAVGYGFFGFATSFWTVVPWVVISSMGYHTWLQTQAALGMSLTTEDKSGSVLGRISAITQGGALSAMAFIFLAFHYDWLDFRGAFVVCGVMALIAALAIFRFPQLHNGEVQEVVPRRDPLVMRRDYRLYYLLSLLDGARQQIFFSFGLWVLVDHFGLDVPAISAVMLVVAFGAMVLGPWIGRQIDVRGERQMLGVVNVAYIVALLGYALVDQVSVAIACFVIYSFIFPFSAMGASIYLRKIAATRDIAPSLAMGLTMQHAAAVVVPIVTGFVLNYVGYQLPFLIASGFAVAAFFVTRMLDPKTQKSAGRIREDTALATQ